MAIEILGYRFSAWRLALLALLLCSALSSYAVNVHELKVYGASVDMPLVAIRRQLLNRGFSERDRPNQEFAGGVDLVFSHSNGDKVLIVSLNGKLLLMKPREIKFKKGVLRVGDSEAKLLLALGKPQRRSKVKGSLEELAFNDEEHLVAFYVHVENSKVTEFVLSPGPEDPG